MSPSLTLPADTYRATYRGSTIVLGVGDEELPEDIAVQMATDAEWMLQGDIDVRVHTMHQSVRSQLRQHLPHEIFADSDMHRPELGLPEMIRRIATSERGDIEEIILLSKLQGLQNGGNETLPLLANTKFDDMSRAHPEHRQLLDAIGVGLMRTPKIVLTGPESLGDEIGSVTGKGTMCFDLNATTYGPMFAYEEPIFRENYARNVADGTYRARTEEELKKAIATHHGMRAGKSILGGFSLVPQAQNRLSAEILWGCSRGGDLGPSLLRHVTDEAGRSSFYAMTVREGVANIFRSHPGMEDLGTISSLQKSGEIEHVAPEHKDYDTTKRDPHFFWHQGKR